jgi:hypothetical protein
MAVTVRNALKALLISNKSDDGSFEQVSLRSLVFFQKIMEDMATEIAEEAAKGNYFKLEPVDIERGYRKWLRSNIQTQELIFKVGKSDCET